MIQNYNQKPSLQTQSFIGPTYAHQLAYRCYCAPLLQPDQFMEAHPHSAITRLAHQLAINLTATQQFYTLLQSLQSLHQEPTTQKQEPSLPLPLPQEKVSTVPQFQKESRLQVSQPVQEIVLAQPQEYFIPVSQAQPEKLVQLEEQPPTTSRREEAKTERQPHSEPPPVSNRRVPTQQSSERSRTNQKDSRQGSRKVQRRSSEQESVNFQLTQKTKQSKNMSLTNNKVDSLLYSDATLMYSHDTGFDRLVPHHTDSHRSVLKQVQDEEAAGEINAKMERAESREVDRVRTESQKGNEAIGQRLQSQQQEEGNIFQTQINEYKNKISQVRELKESKKRKLQAELKKLNQELDDLTKRQHEAVEAAPKPNNFQSRAKISDNLQAKVKAERFVKELHHQKRSRQDAQLGELQVIDKNINDYMQELMKERYKNEQRIRQRKKLEIIDRMKQQELRKIQEQRQKDKNVQFVHHLRTSNSKADLYLRRISENQNSQPQPQPEIKNKQRSPTKKSEASFDSKETPELQRKKAYLKKIRNLSFRKQKVDAYEQVLN